MGVTTWKREGVWYARGTAYTPDGETVPFNESTGIEAVPGSKRLADQAASRIYLERCEHGRKRARAKVRSDLSPDMQTVAAAVRLYCKGKRPGSTAVKVAGQLDEELGRVRLDKLTKERAEGFCKHSPHLAKLGREMSAYTLQTRRAYVNAVLNKVRDEGWTAVPRWRLGGRLELDIRQDNWLCAEDRDAVIAACEAWWRPLMVFLFMTGARPVEACRLRYRHLLVGRRYPQPLVELWHKKGHKDNGEPIWKMRRIPLPKRALKAIRDTGPWGEPEGYVFLDKGLRAMVDQAGEWVKTWTPYAEAFQRAGYEAVGTEDFTPYWCRHTYASLLMQSGKVSERELADLLGHADTKYVKRYAKLAPDYGESAREVLDGAPASVGWRWKRTGRARRSPSASGSTPGG